MPFREKNKNIKKLNAELRNFALTMVELYDFSAKLAKFSGNAHQQQSASQSLLQLRVKIYDLIANITELDGHDSKQQYAKKMKEIEDMVFEADLTILAAMLETSLRAFLLQNQNLLNYNSISRLSDVGTIHGESFAKYLLTHVVDKSPQAQATIRTILTNGIPMFKKLKYVPAAFDNALYGLKIALMTGDKNIWVNEDEDSDDYSDDDLELEEENNNNNLNPPPEVSFESQTVNNSLLPGKPTATFSTTNTTETITGSQHAAPTVANTSYDEKSEHNNNISLATADVKTAPLLPQQQPVYSAVTVNGNPTLFQQKPVFTPHPKQSCSLIKGLGLALMYATPTVLFALVGFGLGGLPGMAIGIITGLIAGKMLQETFSSRENGNAGKAGFCPV